MGSDQLTLATLWSGTVSELVTTRHTIALRHAISPFKVCADIAIVIALESKLKAQLLPKDVQQHLPHVRACILSLCPFLEARLEIPRWRKLHGNKNPELPFSLSHRTQHLISSVVKYIYIIM